MAAYIVYFPIQKTQTTEKQSIKHIKEQIRNSHFRQTKMVIYVENLVQVLSQPGFHFYKLLFV